MRRDPLVIACGARGTWLDIHGSPDAHELLRSMLGALERPDGGEAGATFTLHRQVAATGPWQVWRDDELLMGCERLSEALHGLMVYVTQHVVGARDDVLSVHAAGVVLGGAGVLLPASSGSGKTTLCARLLQRGAAYLSDDSVALTPDGRLLGYAKPLGFKPGTWERFAGSAGVADLADLAVDPGQMVWHVPPSRLGAPTAADSDLALVAGPRFTPGASLQIDDMTRHEAARELLAQAQNLAAFGLLAALDVIGAVVAATPCVLLTYGDAVEAATALVELATVGERGTPAPYQVTKGRPPDRLRANPAPAADVGALCFDDGGVLVRGESGEVLTIDAVGARIWPLVDGSRSLGAVAADLSATFDAPPAQIHADVLTWVDQLVGRGFLARPG